MMIKSLVSNFFDELKSADFSGDICCDEDVDLAYASDWSMIDRGRPQAVVFPKCVADVQLLVQLACRYGQPLVPSGGRTGMAGGAVAGDGEVVVSFDKMCRITDFDTHARTVRCQPGVVTAGLQDFAQQQGLFYPVDLASSGSSQIGGNIATNAGGIRVLKYGMTRSWVQGLTVVTGGGELLVMNHGLRKNNTGYDLMQCFIGSEGTLGLIVEATLGLIVPPVDVLVALFAVDSIADGQALLQYFQKEFSLSSCEIFSDIALRYVLSEHKLVEPFASPASFYVLVEVEMLSPKHRENFEIEAAACWERKIVADALIAQSQQQAKDLWALRENISSSIARFRPYKNDISVPLVDLPDFVAEVQLLLQKEYSALVLVVFGHLGDGNLHLNVLPSEKDTEQSFQLKIAGLSECIAELLKQKRGSVSAEHGIGLLKKPLLSYSRDEAELSIMRGMKRLFDPEGILNPGKIF